MKIFNVLVFPGGTEIGLEIQRALRDCKDVQLFSAGLDISNHAPYVFRRHFTIPSIHESSWLECLNRVILDHAIDYVFPAYDDILLALVENCHRIKARIITSPRETCLITRSKSQTYQHLQGIVPVPVLYETEAEIPNYPVFTKPDRGQGSQDTHVVRSEQQLHVLLKDRNDLIVMEFLPGPEYTVDCFSDRHRGLLYCGGRRRTRTRNGISMNSQLVDNDVFIKYARAISSCLSLHGAWFFQLKEDWKGDCKLLEIAPRIAGTMGLHRVMGVNFPLLSIYEQEGVHVSIRPNTVELEIDRALVNRFKHNIKYETVYVDLDDTLIVHGKINLSLVKFLYQCVNQKVRIVLLTRHASDIENTLRQHKLSGLFDQTIHVEPSQCKTDYIVPDDAIFIDDSFSERGRVAERFGIPTFDCSMLEMLLDDRD